MTLTRWRHLFDAALVVLCFTPVPTHAHAVSTSYVRLDTAGPQPVLEVDEPLRDVDDAINLDTTGDGDITWGKVRTAAPRIVAWITAGIVAERGGERCTERARPIAVELHAGTMHVAQVYDLSCRAQGAWSIDYTLLFDRDRSHRVLLAIATGDSDRPFAAVLDADRHRWDQGTSGLARFTEFIRQGVWHIWQGYDHIAFLLLLLMPSVLKRGPDGRWVGARDIGIVVRHTLGVVTAFTLAHSITLSLSALGILNPPALPVEAGIAATVALAGLANLFPRLAAHGARIAFTFGLIHGFGFANALREVGIAHGAILAPLAGFNIGVELGQLAIVACTVPLLVLCRDLRSYPRVFLPTSSLAVSALACWWLLQRVGLV